MKTISRGMLFVYFVLALILLTGILTWMGFHAGWDVIVDGEPVTGLLAVCYAFGGTLFGILAVVLALMFAGLVVTGVSLFVVLLLAGIFAGVVILLSPLTLPLLAIVGLYFLLRRRKQRPAVAQIEAPTA